MYWLPDESITWSMGIIQRIIYMYWLPIIVSISRHNFMYQLADICSTRYYCMWFIQSLWLCNFESWQSMQCSFGCLAFCEVYAILQSMQLYNCINRMIYVAYAVTWLKNCKNLPWTMLQFNAVQFWRLCKLCGLCSFQFWTLWDLCGAVLRFVFGPEVCSFMRSMWFMQFFFKNALAYLSLA